MIVKFTKLSLVLLFTLSLSAFSQQKTVSGKVVDNIGAPLPGVSVLVKGTNTGTQTDFDGNYSINVSQGQVLIFR